MKTKIKICGFTSEDELGCIRAGEVALAGMVVFCPESRRSISLLQAKKIMEAVPEGTGKVAVTVSPSLEEVLEIEAAGFDYVQIHGILHPEILRHEGIPIIRAVNGKNMAALEEDGRICAWLFDSACPGSGRTFDWEWMSSIRQKNKPWILAGGLTPSNVGEAIRSIHPAMVDVSSGVEYTQGKGKDPEKIRAFIRAVAEADQEKI